MLRILGFALVFALPGRFLKGLLASIDRQRSLLAANAMTIAIGVSVGWLMIPEYGIVGTAGAVLAAEVATLGALARVYAKSLRASATQ